MDYKTKTSLILPFKGAWMVQNGGRTHDKNNHQEADGSGPKSQKYAYDFCSRWVKDQGKKLEDYESFGAEVISPGEGVVSQIIDGCVDVEIGERDSFVFPGNMVIIDHQNGEWSVLSHFKHDSIKVNVGNTLKQGDLVGLCGNTGNTSEPHIHYQLQDNALMHRANGLPAQFTRIKVNDEIKERYEPERNERVENI